MADLRISNLGELATPAGTVPLTGSRQGVLCRRHGVEVLCRDGRVAAIGSPDEITDAITDAAGDSEKIRRLDADGGTLDDIAIRWSLGVGEVVEPGRNATARRSVYARARDNYLHHGVRRA